MAWKVRYIDYPTHYASMRQEILDIVDDTLSKGDVMLRQQLADFEAHLAQFCETGYAVGVGNCTEALHLSLLAAGVGTGDEVITVSHTFVATAAAIHHTGATPVFVDIDDDHNMSVAQIEAAVTPQTKAIMPVHLNGRVCRMDAVLDVARDHGLLVIEDAAQALGGSFSGSKAGSFGLAGCFSFYPAKLLGAFGDGGAVVTNSPDMYKRIRELRDHGRTEDGGVAGWSFNSRLDNIHAAMLDFKLTKLPGWIQRRRELAAAYHEALGQLPELHLPPPPVDEGEHYDVYQNFEIEADGRDQLRASLTEAGVETMLPWGGTAIHQFPALGLTDYHLPRTERMFERVLMLPMNPDLNDDDVTYVCDVVRSFYR
jgi:dTDP-4-amino-4,6-dideoxygalactose transaminase